MAHIHTEPGQHDATTSAYIVRLDGSEPRILLHKHKLLGRYFQVGGHIELNENPWQALTHEVREESGYDMDQLQLLQPQVRFRQISRRSIMHPVPFYYNTHPFGDEGKHFHTDTGFAFITHEAPRNAVGEGESDTVLFLTAAELQALTDDQIYAEIREAALYVLETLVNEWEATPAAQE